MPKLGDYDNPDLEGIIITKVYVQSLFDYLTERHGEDAPDIIEKFNNVERNHVIVKTDLNGEEIDGFFMIPSLSGWHNSNLRKFIALNNLDSDVDTSVQADLDKWVGREVKGVLQKTSDGTFLRLAK